MVGAFIEYLCEVDMQALGSLGAIAVGGAKQQDALDIVLQCMELWQVEVLTYEFTITILAH